MEALNIYTPLTIKPNEFIEFNVKDKSLEEQVKLSILRDLWNLNWEINLKENKIKIIPPKYYNKEIIRQSMGIKRDEIINKNKSWIYENIHFARQNLANGPDVLKSEIRPIIEICEKEKQHRLFRILRYYWSSPYSEYVGRRIKLIIRDGALPNKPVIGIAALGSPIIHIPERDNFIGWDNKTRTSNLIYAMDAYVIGALPPYSYLLGGKLISYILASNEIRNIYKKKYSHQVTLISKRKCKDLIGIFTTSLYGKSSQYNKLKYYDRLLYQKIGETKGYGTLHLSENTIETMKKYLSSKKIYIGYNFGDGPSWRMRLIRTLGELLGFNSDILLQHSFKRSIYFVPLAENSIEIFNGKEKKPKYFDYPLGCLINYWKDRWLLNRKHNPKIVREILKFNTKNFKI